MKLKLNWKWTVVSIKQANGDPRGSVPSRTAVKAKQTSPQPIVMSDLSMNPTAKLLLIYKSISCLWSVKWSVCQYIQDHPVTMAAWKHVTTSVQGCFLINHKEKGVETKVCTCVHVSVFWQVLKKKWIKSSDRTVTNNNNKANKRMSLWDKEHS